MTAATAKSKVHLKRRGDVQSLAIVVLHLSAVLAPVYKAAATGPSWITLGCRLWCGLLQHGLTNLMHETAHKHVFKRGSWNEVLGFWVLGPIFVADFFLYRARHWIHHREIGSEQDTKSTYLIQLTGRHGLGFLISAMLGIEAGKKFFLPMQQKGRVEQVEKRTGPPALLTIVVFQAVCAGSLALTALGTSRGDLALAALRFFAAYGFVYVYGMMSLTIIMATLRAVAEHQKGDDAPAAGRAALRNLRAGPIGQVLFGCYGFSDHATHHRYPMVPAYNLPKLTTELGAEDPAYLPRESYWSMLRHLTANRSSG